MSLLVLPSGRALRALAAVVAITAAVPSLASAALPSTARVSVSSTAAEANGVSGRPSVSADGRFVAFESNANNLAGTDGNGTTDVFLRDRQTGQTLRVSSAPNGAAGDGTSSSPAMSADGRLVVFISTATTLVPGSTGSQLFLYDRVANAVRRLPDLVSGYISPSTPLISNDGARVVYRAVAGSRADVFAVDVATGATRRVSERSDGAAGNGTTGFNAFDPALSGDGRWVAFATNATDLAPPDANPWRDIVGRDLSTGALTRLSVGSGNAEANLHSSTPALSGDGCIAAFFSSATNLVAGDTGTQPKVFARNRCTGDTELVSVSNAGVQGIAATPIDISDDGCRVVFEAASVVSPAPSSGNAAVLRDRCQGATSRLDLSSAGDPGAGGVTEVAISPGTGRYVAFVTSSAGLVGTDANGLSDVFVRDLATNVAPVAALSVSASGLTVTADASASTDPDGFGASATISYGDGSPAQNGLRGTHAFPRAGTYGVSVTVTDSDGVSSSKTVAVTVADAPSAGGPGGPAQPGGSGPPTPPNSAAKLVLDRLSLSPARFAVVGKGKKPDRRHGGELTLRLSAPATVTVRFQRARTGRKVKGRCRPSARKGAKCSVYSDAGTITKKLGAGTSTIVLTGRIGSRTLATAKHRLTVSARGADGQTTSARTLTLTIVKATTKKKGK